MCLVRFLLDLEPDPPNPGFDSGFDSGFESGYESGFESKLTSGRIRIRNKQLRIRNTDFKHNPQNSPGTCTSNKQYGEPGKAFGHA